MRKREARELKRLQISENNVFTTEGIGDAEKSERRGGKHPAICMDVNIKDLRKE